jgi:hypothetical protein
MFYNRNPAVRAEVFERGDAAEVAEGKPAGVSGSYWGRPRVT